MKPTCCKIDGLPDLLTQMACGDFQNLKVFLSRNKCNELGFPQDFLFVDSQSFGRVTVNQVDYRNETITVDITDCSTCMAGTLCIDVNEHERPEFMMVNWTDVVDIVREYQTNCWGCDDLLEFEF